MNFVHVLFHLSFVWTVAGRQAGRIFNGQEACPGQFPFMVGIDVEKEVGSYYCGGSLIAKSWVLTAAHSVHNAILLNIYLGASNLEESHVCYIIPGSDVHTHTNFRFHLYTTSMTMDNNIALIKIPPTDFCDNVFPISIVQAISEEISYPGQYGVTSGWGYTRDRGALTMHLRWGRMKIVGHDLCNRWLRLHPRHHICVDTRSYSSTCYGDSGGPLLLESSGELIGVASHVVGPSCELGTPEVFIRVSSYLDWIKSTTGIP